MAQTRRLEPHFPRRLILGAALMGGMLLALAVHMLSQRFGLDIGELWLGRANAGIPFTAALAWWLLATAAFVSGYATARLMDRAMSGQIPRPMRNLLVGILVLFLAGAGQAAAGPSALPTIAGILSGLTALALGALMAFCGAHFALRHA